jgi:bifunctional polynucleotide phosphatase/kinase
MPARASKRVASKKAAAAAVEEEEEVQEEEVVPKKGAKRPAESVAATAPVEKNTTPASSAATSASAPSLSFTQKVPDGIVIPASWIWHQSLLLTQIGECKASTKIAGFDYDGCLAKTSLFKKGPDAWSVLFPTCKPYLTSLHAQGYKIVIFTNQAEIGKAKASKQKSVSEKIARLGGFVAEMGLPIQVFAATDKDEFRKPGVAMWEFFSKYFNEGVIPDKATSFYVGDAAGRKKDHGDGDMGFAKNVGIKFYTETDFFQSNAHKL